MLREIMTIAIDQEAHELVALTPWSRVEIARAWVPSVTTADHIAAAKLLVQRAFEDLEAQGYERACQVCGRKKSQ